MPLVIEMTGYNVARGVDVTCRFSLGAPVNTTDVGPIPSGALSWRSASQKIDVSKSGGLSVGVDLGQVVLNNSPKDVYSAGPWDALADYIWQGKTVSLYRLDGTTWADATLVAFGTLEQPGANLSQRGDGTSTLVWPLRDPRSTLDVPLQTKAYGGSNVDGVGVDGDADIKGRRRPIIYGVVSNTTPVRVNPQKLIFDLCDAAATILCVRDGSLSLTPGTMRATLASLQDNDPGASKYDWYAGAEGTYIRLGSSPTFQLTADVQEGATYADRTHAQIWKRIRQERCGNVAGDFNTASIAAADLVAPNECGFYWASQESCREAVDEVLESLMGYEVLGFDGKWKIGSIAKPEGTPKVDISILGPNSRLKASSRPMRSLTRVQPNSAPNGAPPHKVTVRWGRNYTIMRDADFAGAAIDRLRDKFSEEWRSEVAVNTTIWDPDEQTGLWRYSGEITVNTGYQPGDDGVTCPHAAELAEDLLDLYSAFRAQYQVEIEPDVADRILPGDVVRLTHPQFGLSGGSLFLVFQAGLAVDNNRLVSELVLGFGPAAPITSITADTTAYTADTTLLTADHG